MYSKTAHSWRRFNGSLRGFRWVIRGGREKSYGVKNKRQTKNEKKCCGDSFLSLFRTFRFVLSVTKSLSYTIILVIRLNSVSIDVFFSFLRRFLPYIITHIMTCRFTILTYNRVNCTNGIYISSIYFFFIVNSIKNFSSGCGVIYPIVKLRLSI